MTKMDFNGYIPPGYLNYLEQNKYVLGHEYAPSYDNRSLLCRLNFKKVYCKLATFPMLLLGNISRYWLRLTIAICGGTIVLPVYIFEGYMYCHVF